MLEKEPFSKKISFPSYLHFLVSNLFKEIGGGDVTPFHFPISSPVIADLKAETLVFL